MFYRKIADKIEEHFKSKSDKILLIDGARQVGKTFIIRAVIKKYFANVIEINMLEDKAGLQLYANVSSVDDFYLQVSATYGNKMKDKDSTIIFIDEIQAYPKLLTLLKFLKQDNRFNYIASGSQLGVALSKTVSIPMGSITTLRMYPMDFEEFLLANGSNEFYISTLKGKFEKLESLDEASHNRLLKLFKTYLLTGGLPDAVKAYVEQKNIQAMRRVQDETHEFYAADASQYDTENKLKIRKIYDMLPSNLENKKKRLVIQHIEEKRGKSYSDYVDEFEYLISSGIALNVQAISTPTFPLVQSSEKNLLKLYLNDVGIFTSVLYRENIRAVLDDIKSINLGSVYESVVAQELRAHDFKLFYYDNKSKGEVDFLIDDYDSLSVVPIEVKSGKDYTVHSALDKFVSNDGYNVKRAYVLSNEREIKIDGKVIYMPIYFIMFFSNKTTSESII